MFQIFKKKNNKINQIYYCAHRPIVGKSMKGYLWEYFEKYVLTTELKRNPYKFHYYIIEGKHIHPDFWKNDTSSVLRVSSFKQIDISEEMRVPYLKV